MKARLDPSNLFRANVQINV
ncbi:hypothetical protein [Alsobacter sp. R-9]